MQIPNIFFTPSYRDVAHWSEKKMDEPESYSGTHSKKSLYY